MLLQLSGLAYFSAYKTRWPSWAKDTLDSVFSWDGGMPAAYGSSECILRERLGDDAVLWKHGIWIILPAMWLLAVTLLGGGGGRWHVGCA